MSSYVLLNQVSYNCFLCILCTFTYVFVRSSSAANTVPPVPLWSILCRRSHSDQSGTVFEVVCD